jgi:predicted DNA-binding transcriptional regulator AlpA
MPPSALVRHRGAGGVSAAGDSEPLVIQAMATVTLKQRRIVREEPRPRSRRRRDTKGRETTMGVNRMPPGEPYVTAREVAERVGLSSDTILRYYRLGKIPGRRMPGQIRPVRFLWSEVEAAFNGIADQAAEDARREWVGRIERRAA